MGVVNVTPDSFSDGGLWDTPAAAIAHGRSLLADGADILDIGGESTRPGATRPVVEEEVGRVVPVIRTLAADGARVSVDTMRSEVAEQALAAGATIVNDVSGGLADPRILDVVAASGATYVCMHWRGHSDRMQDLAAYDGPGGVVAAVRDELCERIEAAQAAGIPDEQIVLDPGLGFAKNADQNWEVLGHLREFETLGYPVLIGASRKRFLGALLPEGTPTDDRDPASAVISALAAEAGAWGVRVHDVAATKAALDVWEAWSYGARSGGNPS
jgi:dihydropteroate synthase